MQRPDGKFIYQSGTFNSFNISTSIPEGGDWSFAYNYDRKAFDVKNVEKDKIIKLNFYEKETLIHTVLIRMLRWAFI